jgi:aminomethyltransferase
MTDTISTPQLMHCYDEESYGRIIMTGRDSAALLQRLTTNDVLALQPNQGLQTVLTTPIGRIIDVLHVIKVGDALWVLTSPGQGPAVYSHLKKNIFFNDHITLNPAARSHRQVAIYGSGATAFVGQLSGRDLAAIPQWQATVFVVAEADIIATPIAPLAGGGWRLLIPTDVFAACGLDGLPVASDALLNQWQIESFVPAYGHELSTEYIPLEAGLEQAISFKKGCYVGQEIIARMESRGRRAKQLSRVRLAALVTTPTALTTTAGRDAGVVTRVIDSPRYGIIGLAYLKTQIDVSEPLCVGEVVVQRCDDAWQGV